ncbi:hypothetical protein [Burkholderia plantarii]|nr:hypothetical protein [Burkholderia plantarii]
MPFDYLQPGIKSVRAGFGSNSIESDAEDYDLESPARVANHVFCISRESAVTCWRRPRMTSEQNYNIEAKVKFIKWLIGDVIRDFRLKKLKADFDRHCPNERMAGTIDGYCGIGMMIGRAERDAGQAAHGHAKLLDVYSSSLVAELAQHREYARRAYRIGVESVQYSGRRPPRALPEARRERR